MIFAERARFRSRTLAGCRIIQNKDDILIVREAARCPIQNVIPGGWMDWDNRYRILVSTAGEVKTVRFSRSGLGG